MVENTVLWDCEPLQSTYPGYTIVQGSTGAVGWKWDGAILSPPESVTLSPAAITKLQLTLGLVADSLITPSEGEAMAEGAALPAAVAAAIDALPKMQRTEAKIRWHSMTEFERTDPLLVAVAAAAGKSEAQLDQMFRSWSRL